MRWVAVLLGLFLAGGAAAAEPQLGPVIEGYGPAYAVPELDAPLPRDFDYRVVFDLAEGPRNSTSPHQGLVGVARFMNMHARHGVPVEKMDLAVVLHGQALFGALSERAHTARFDSPNSNLELLGALSAAGVKFYACGQSMAHREIEAAHLAGPVKVALSAMTMLVLLQAEGYALIPWWG